MSLEIAPSDKNFATEIAAVGRLAVGVQPDVLVQIARVTERSQAEFALQWLVAGVCSEIRIKKVD